MAKKAAVSTKKRQIKKEQPVEGVEVQQPKVESKNDYTGEEGIDIVVPMVFPNGSRWLAAYREACDKNGREAKIDNRVRSWGLERYFFRGIAKFMPFVRKIHLILSDEGQIPFWLDREKVHIVLHNEIMPESVLPTFNSSAIEMWLHNIKGLSETFIYCNDDMIATAPMTAEDFFIDGKPVTRCEVKNTPISNDFLKMCKNTLTFVANDYGKTFAENELLRDGHSYAPMLTSVIREFAAKHEKEMLESCTTFRDIRNMNQYAYTYAMYFAGKCVNGYHTHRYFSLSSDYDEMNRMLLSGTAGIACFNDGGIGDWSEMRSFLFQSLQQILGEKCNYEV